MRIAFLPVERSRQRRELAHRRSRQGGSQGPRSGPAQRVERSSSLDGRARSAACLHGARLSTSATLSAMALASLGTVAPVHCTMISPRSTTGTPLRQASSARVRFSNSSLSRRRSSASSRRDGASRVERLPDGDGTIERRVDLGHAAPPLLSSRDCPGSASSSCSTLASVRVVQSSRSAHVLQTPSTTRISLSSRCSIATPSAGTQDGS